VTRFTWLVATAFLGALIVGACGESAPVQGVDSMQGTVDVKVSFDVGAPEPDLPAVETVGDLQANEDTSGQDDGCQSDDDCPAGVCVPTPAGAFCTSPCGEDNVCPETHYCDGGEPAVCQPLHAALCRPCLKDEDCGGEASGARCAQFAGLGTFCATLCGSGCPETYACEAVTLLDSTTTQRCVLGDGSVCACSESAIEEGLATGCSVSNDHGTCYGLRLCGPDGLGECDATTPTAEVCGGGDENCNGPIDESGAEGCLEFFQDTDQDGLGEDGNSFCYCQPEGLFTALKGGDCDDNDSMVGECQILYADLDDDGWGDGDDSQCLCAPEWPYTATNTGCKEDDGSVVPCSVWYVDADGDGVGTDESQCLCAIEGDYKAPTDGDCDDSDPAIDFCWDHFYDADADGVGDENLMQCLCGPAGLYTALLGGDCDDEEPLSAPGKIEVCDGVDNDCNGLTDEEGASDCVVYLYDGDKDSFGVAAKSKCLCKPFGKYTTTKPGDCNDLDSNIFPGQPCSPPQCEGFIISGLCPEGTCGEGSEAAPCSGGFVCQDPVSCRESCSSKEHCAPGKYCVAGACIGEGLDGSPCNKDDECASDHCANGFCCEWGDCCSGDDADCNDGNDCTEAFCDASFVCQKTELDGSVCVDASCQGSVFTEQKYCVEGACLLGGKKVLCSTNNPCETGLCSPEGCAIEAKPVGTGCGDFTCSGFELVQPKTCDGEGSCSGGGQVEVCANSFTCLNNTQCRESCDIDAHCQPDTYCEQGSCAPLKADGLPCVSDAQCEAGSCQGGYCCAGCCDGGTIGSDQYARAVEICGETYFAVEGNSQCRRIISDFGKFSHDDKDPSLGDTSMAQLSTGIAANMQNQQGGENTGTSGADPDGTVGTVYDLCGFTVKLKVPANAKGMAFDFIFFSSEYPEWVGTQFNDSFNVMLKSELFDGNVAFDNQGNPISINNVLFNTFGNALAGTGYDNGVGGSTGWLTTTVPLVPGETITIRFVIYDEGDHVYDSDVLLNNFRWLEFQPGVGPVTE
jgi:hypothetical protein